MNKFVSMMAVVAMLGVLSLGSSQALGVDLDSGSAPVSIEVENWAYVSINDGAGAAPAPLCAWRATAGHAAYIGRKNRSVPQKGQGL